VNWDTRRVVLLIVALSGGCSEEFESRYSTKADAVRDGAIVRGWIPDILPADAVDIREVHNIDTNRTWCCFTTPGGVEQVRNRLQEVGAKRESSPGPEGKTPAWWPATPPDETHALPEPNGFIVRIRMNLVSKTVCFSRGVS
jgi:hypothetical protein